MTLFWFLPVVYIFFFFSFLQIHNSINAFLAVLCYQVYLQDEERLERRERVDSARREGGCAGRGGAGGRAASLVPCEDNAEERKAAAKVGRRDVSQFTPRGSWKATTALL